MQRDELDQLLSQDALIAPSPGFAESVMSEIRREVAARPALRFPWGAVLAGSTLLTVGLLVGIRLELTAQGAAWSARWDDIGAVLYDRTVHWITASTNPTAVSLGLAALVMLIPVAAYEWAMRARRFR